MSGNIQHVSWNSDCTWKLCYFLSYDTKISRLLKASYVCPQIYGVCFNIFRFVEISGVCMKISSKCLETLIIQKYYICFFHMTHQLPDCSKFQKCISKFLACVKKCWFFLLFRYLSKKFHQSNTSCTSRTPFTHGPFIGEIWYKQWKVRSGCVEKVALGNSRGQLFQTTTKDFPLFIRVLD